MTDAVLIVGAGIAGLTAAQRVSAAGARAIVVERKPVVGGRLAAPMTRAGAIGDRAEGESVPLFDALAADQNIEIIQPELPRKIGKRFFVLNLRVARRRPCRTWIVTKGFNGNLLFLPLHKACVLQPPEHAVKALLQA